MLSDRRKRSEQDLKQEFKKQASEILSDREMFETAFCEIQDEFDAIKKAKKYQ